MLISKVIALSMLLSYTTAFGFEIINDKKINYHPPAEKIKVILKEHVDKTPNAIKSPAIIQENPVSNSEENLPLNIQVDPLIAFMDASIQLQAKELYKINSQVGLQNVNYKYLNSNEILLKEEWYSSKDNLADSNTKLKKLKKMQKLATYISTTYDVPLINAEKIVYYTFVEAIKKNLEPLLILSLIDVESTFKTNITSRAGAVGLTQVMPRIHREKVVALRKENMDILSITGNIKVGTQILKEYVDLAGGNLKKALQMYNGSSKDGSYKYSKKILAKMHIFNKVSVIEM